jgi:hypothetical protein
MRWFREEGEHTAGVTATPRRDRYAGAFWRVIAAVLIAASAAAARHPKPGPATAGVLLEPPPGKSYHGVFPGGNNGMGGDITPRDLLQYQRAVGKRPTWVYFCNNWYESPAFPLRTATWIRANGSVPYIRLMLLSSARIPRPDPVYSLEKIIAGELDENLRNWMREARKFATPLLAEYGVEVNGWWFPWNGLYNRGEGAYEDSVARFREAYRHIIRIARAEGAYNIRWVFHVDPWDEPVEEWNRLENYYPGDEWIDWVGVSVYGRQVPKDRHAVSFRFQMDWVYERLQRLTDKPAIVCEFGTIDDRHQVAWAQAALQDLLRGRWPKVIGFSWWNAAFKNDPVTGRWSNMRVQENPALVAVFRKYVAKEPSVISRPLVRPLKLKEP